MMIRYAVLLLSAFLGSQISFLDIAAMAQGGQLTLPHNPPLPRSKSRYSTTSSLVDLRDAAMFGPPVPSNPLKTLQPPLIRVDPPSESMRRIHPPVHP